MQMDQASKDLTTMATLEEEPVVMYDYYEVAINDEVIGYVPDAASADILYTKAYEALVEQIGYDPELVKGLTTIPITSEVNNVSIEADISTKMADVLYDSIDDIKVKAYVMKIGEEFVVALESEEALKEVLEGAQSLYVNDDSGISVKLTKDVRNNLVMVPEITVLRKELPEERIFLTAELLAQVTGGTTVAEETDEEADESDDDAATTGSDEESKGEPMEDLSADDSEFVESVVKDVVLEQSIIIVETFISESEIKSVEDATLMITKENEKEKLYSVEKGDCPSVIAVENGMSTRDLYSMNPGLEENANKMQIGDELVVMVPEPELFVTTVEDVIYTEVIDREVTYVNNPDEYVGTNSVISAGSDGILEVRATICKVNGKEVDRTILGEAILLEPKTEKVLRGTKALPVTTATGIFDMPLTSYTFMSGFGPRWGGRQHRGIDLSAPTGTSVKASDGGRVIKSGWNGGYGYMIEIDHGNGLTSRYAHNSALYVSVGEEVAKYQTIAAVGSTGNSTGPPHVHFEIRKNGVAQNPMNYLK